MTKDLYRFIHLSDIHFGQETDGTFTPHDDVRAQLIKDCVAHAATLSSPPDGILITGDTAFRGTHDEYQRAGKWLELLAHAVGCDVLLIRTIPGNHDIDRSEIHHFCNLAHEDIRGKDTSHVDACLEAMSKREEDGNTLLAKLAAYRVFAARFGCDFESMQKPFWRKTYPFSSGHKLVLVGLNSVQVSDATDDQGRMVLGNKQYILPDDDNVEYVVMVHHPLHWLKDREAAGRYLKRARVIMVGHEHSLSIQKVQDDLGREQVEIYAGATNPPETGPSYPFRYNWIEFSLDENNGNFLLRVTVNPRRWDFERTQFGPDLARLSGTSSFDLKCPHYKSIPCSPAAPIARAVRSVANEEQCSMDDIHEQDFERLQYFFWTYLDWDQRLKALASADVLPHVPTQPMPQTLERLALEAARSKGVLYKLWEIVMAHVPTEKRNSNPFPQNS